MKVTLMMTRYPTARAVLIGSATCALLACGTAAAPQQLHNARHAYTQASQGPAAQLAPAQLDTARQAVERANMAFASGADEAQVTDMAYVAERQVAIAVSAAALESGMTPASLLTGLDEPVETPQGGWVPEDEHLESPAMTVRTALRTSSNRAAVRAFQTVGLEKEMTAIDRLPSGTRALVACHHPLVEAGTRGKAWTHGGDHALAELARRGVLATLSGHVHDAFDIVSETPHGPMRMIGAGTLSQRIRSTPQSFNEITWDGERINVRVRSIADVPTEAMQVKQVPEDAMPPREPDEPVAPVNNVPRVDPPVH